MNVTTTYDNDALLAMWKTYEQKHHNANWGGGYSDNSTAYPYNYPYKIYEATPSPVIDELMVKDIIRDVLRNDYTTNNMLRNLIYQIIKDELRFIFHNDADVRLALITALAGETGNFSLQYLIIDALKNFKFTVKERGQEYYQTEFNELLEPIHSPKDEDVERAVKLV